MGETFRTRLSPLTLQMQDLLYIPGGMEPSAKRLIILHIQL
jgi:hypothetical protein